MEMKKKNVDFSTSEKEHSPYVVSFANPPMKIFLHISNQISQPIRRRKKVRKHREGLTKNASMLE